MYDNILVPTDGSKTAENAVDQAVDIASKYGATVHALYVVDVDEVESSPDRLRDEMEEALVERGDEALADVAASTDREVTTAVETGHPPSVITDYARNHDADVVALGTRGRHGENRFLIGSVAERVVRSCPIPVLTVRELE